MSRAYYGLVDAVEKERSRGSEEFADGIADNLLLLVNVRGSVDVKAIVHFDMMQRLALVDHSGQLTAHGRGVYNELRAEGHYGGLAAERTLVPSKP